jgi:hypothetical protein
MEFGSRPNLSRPQNFHYNGPIIIHPHFSKPFFLESDVIIPSKYVIGVVLLQNGEDE